MKYFILLASLIILNACTGNNNTGQLNEAATGERPVLDIEVASRLAGLPIACIKREYPNKLNQTLSGDGDLLPPHRLHPAFYGCFDWHSSVHGHWSLVMLLKHFPEMEQAEEMKALLWGSLSEENIAAEIDYFRQEQNSTFERTYGWAWLLKLAEELYTWDTEYAGELYDNIYPLAAVIADMYTDFLPRLQYPIRVGTHTNTAFGLSFAWDYAISTGNDSLLLSIKQRARDFYLYDRMCPVSWEPGGNDFLSPCLEEAAIMRRVLDQEEYARWLAGFMPELSDPSWQLEPGIVTDKSDGQLAHLDGLNFSRAWCLYGIASSLPGYKHLVKIADKHIMHSLPSISHEHYEGGHWLASFALLALYSQ